VILELSWDSRLSLIWLEPCQNLCQKDLSFTVGVAFIFPACVMFVYADRSYTGRTRIAYRAGAVVLFLVGLGMMANGVVPPLLSALSGS
jgi:hypothetical protein